MKTLLGKVFLLVLLVGGGLSVSQFSSYRFKINGEIKLPSHYLCSATLNSENYTKVFMEHKKKGFYSIKDVYDHKLSTLKARQSCIESGGIIVHLISPKEEKEYCELSPDNLPPLCKKALLPSP